MIGSAAEQQQHTGGSSTLRRVEARGGRSSFNGNVHGRNTDTARPPPQATDGQPPPDDAATAYNAATAATAAIGQAQSPSPRSSPVEGVSSTTHDDENEVMRHEVPLQEDVDHIDEMDWGDDDGLRPRLDRHGDPCGCTPNPFGGRGMCCVDASCVLFACQEECRSNCEAGNLCGNRRITRKQWKKLQVFDAGQKGRGLRTVEPIKRGEFITEYVGVAVKRKELERVFRKYQFERMLYIMSLDANTYIDARKRGGIARYINHSCEPNCVVDRWKVRGVLRAGIFASRDIDAGEELNFDYQWERKRGRTLTKCHCNTPSCRGTLELPRSNEDELLEVKLKGHWKTGVKGAKAELCDRVVKVYFDGNHEYFRAKVSQFDESTFKHLLTYDDNTEEWEDLSKENWMILDEEAETFVIARKKENRQSSEGTPIGSSLLTPHKRGKNQLHTIIVPSAVKEEMVCRRLIGKCERHCRVNIILSKCVRDKHGMGGWEGEEEKRALDESDDGVVWKLEVSGLGIEKALGILQRNVDEIQSQLKSAGSSPNTPSPTRSSDSSSHPCKEMVIPRALVDVVKARLPVIRGHCRNVQCGFGPSNSKSKSFAKIVLKGSLMSDVLKAQEVFWREICTMCTERALPFAAAGIPANVGHLAGVLTRKDLCLLLGHGDDGFKLLETSVQDSHFLATFSKTFSCSIWIQSESDMASEGQTTPKVKQTEVSSSECDREVYIACEPMRLDALWSMILTRVEDLKAGVRFLRIDPRYLDPALSTYIQRTTDVNVSEDKLTGEWLRFDDALKTGDSPNGKLADEEDNCVLPFAERAKMAATLVVLQLQMKTDHIRRQRYWGFGKDWTQLADVNNLNNPGVLLEETKLPSSCTSQSLDDPRAVSNLCLDLAEISECLCLGAIVAAHAATILYRFVHMTTHLSDKSDAKSAAPFKPREVALACFFIANKAQKIVKCKPLEQVIEAAYNLYYPSSSFIADSDEALSWEERVSSAEIIVLEKLNYDVFWRGMDWILSVAVESGMAEPLANNAMELALCGPLLAVGSKAWVRCGPEYVFTALACFLSVDVTNLFSAFSLDPTRLSDAAREIVNYVQRPVGSHKASSRKKKSRKTSRELSSSLKVTIINNLPHVLAVSENMKSAPVGENAGLVRQMEVIARRSQRRRVFALDKAVVKEYILPCIGAFNAECKCQVFIDEGSNDDTCAVIMEGSWRGLALAEELLRKVSCPTEGGGRSDDVSSASKKPPATTGASFSSLVPSSPAASPRLEDRREAKKTVAVPYDEASGGGVLRTGAIDFSKGWGGTISANGGVFGRDDLTVGGKNCLCCSVDDFALREAGLRWWIPQRFGLSSSGSLYDVFIIREQTHAAPREAQEDAVEQVIQGIMGSKEFLDFKDECALGIPSGKEATKTNDCRLAVSLKRWPVIKEKERTRPDKSGKKNMEMGFSPAALQEMQLLHQIHNPIPASQGHPNFMLPLAVSVARQDEQEAAGDASPPRASNSLYEQNILDYSSVGQKMRFSRGPSGREKVPRNGSFILFEPTPLILSSAMSRRKRSVSNREGGTTDSLKPSLFASWFHDLLSALAHCHANHIIVRFLKPDQVLLDHSGTAKISELAGAVVLPMDQRNGHVDPSKSVQREKGRKTVSDPHQAPEILLGATRHSKASDIWSLASVMAGLLLGKPLFTGKDRFALLNSIFKITGSPSVGNFHRGKDFPHYERAKAISNKSYKRGVAKAFSYLLKSNELLQEYSGAINLLDKMLHLDPQQRISAADALNDDYMTDYVYKTNDDGFRKRFANEWIYIKEILTGVVAEDTMAKGHEKTDKDKAMDWFEEGEDDLYKWDDTGDGEPSNETEKKRKLGVDAYFSGDRVDGKRHVPN